MKKSTLFAFLLCWLSAWVYAQLPAQSKAMAELVDAYNSKAFARIHQGFSPEMQEALPLDRTVSFFEGIFAEYARIESHRYTRMEPNGALVFDANFNKGKLEFHLNWNAQNQIDYLLVQPPKAVAQALVNQTNLPNAMAQLAIENLKTMPEGTQLAIGLVNGNETKFYGLSLKAGQLVEVENQKALFEIGSLTKVFTAIMLAQAVKEKKVKLDDPLNTVHGFPFNQNIRLTWKAVANHTSGLPPLPSNLKLNESPANPYKHYKLSDLDLYLAKQLRVRTAASAFGYSNLGYGILGQSLAKVYQQPYESLVEQYILKPLQLSHTKMHVDTNDAQLVKGQNPQGEVTSNWEFDAMAPAGSMVSNVFDLEKFIRAHFNSKNEVLVLPAQATFQASPTFEVGLGWMITYPQSIDQPVLFHNGGTGGYRSALLIDRMAKKGVVVLSNVSSFHQDSALIDQLANELLLQVK